PGLDRVVNLFGSQVLPVNDCLAVNLDLCPALTLGLSLGGRRRRFDYWLGGCSRFGCNFGSTLLSGLSCWFGWFRLCCRFRCLCLSCRCWRLSTARRSSNFFLNRFESSGHPRSLICRNQQFVNPIGLAVGFRQHLMHLLEI